MVGEDKGFPSARKKRGRKRSWWLWGTHLGGGAKCKRKRGSRKKKQLV